ncbi:MAG: hypothetical protein IPI73_14730 [Betaproteobacteria bacterium]|nr:hypothetical protein [Betaproteobacteria bacterium]
MRDADFDHHVAGRGEAADLPAVDGDVVGQMVAPQRRAPERRRHDVVHEAAGDDLVAVRLGADRRFVDFLLADAVGVDVRLVRQVHQVVDHQPVVAGDVKEAAAVRPLRIAGPVQRGDRRGIGLRRVAWPDPVPWRSTTG